MPLPANVTTVTVLGTFLTPEGNPSTGTITFTPSSWLTNSGANVAIPNSPTTKTLGTAGNFSVLLPITDDPDLSPDNWVYNVSEVVDGVSQNYNILLPGTVAVGGTVFLADLVPAAPAGPEYYSLASSLTIGTVTTVATGGSATASITGLAPSQVLNLGIPTGATGTVASAGSGSVGTAAVAPTGDPNTGIYFPAVDQVAVTTGGTERMRVNSTGLGIGVSPSTDFDIVRDAQVSSRWRSAVTSNRGSLLYFDKARGSWASPSSVSNSDGVMELYARAHDGTQVRDVAAIVANIDSVPATNDLGARLSFQTRPSGVAGSVTERMRIDSNGLITGTGSSLGAWVSYTPSLGGTGWAIGNGTAVGAYCQIGKIVHFRLQITFGSTSTFGGVAPSVTMPTGATEIAQGVVGINCRFFDASLSNMYEGLVRNDGINMSLRYYGANALHEAVVSGGPFTWATTDFIRISGSYEAA